MAEHTTAGLRYDLFVYKRLTGDAIEYPVGVYVGETDELIVLDFGGTPRAVPRDKVEKVNLGESA